MKLSSFTRRSFIGGVAGTAGLRSSSGRAFARWLACPSGPLLKYMPDKVKKVPTTAEELLAYTRENKNRFMTLFGESGPRRTFLMGLPYILGELQSERSGKRLGQDLGVYRGYAKY